MGVTLPDPAEVAAPTTVTTAIHATDLLRDGLTRASGIILSLIDRSLIRKCKAHQYADSYITSRGDQ